MRPIQSNRLELASFKTLSSEVKLQFVTIHQLVTIREVGCQLCAWRILGFQDFNLGHRISELIDPTMPISI